MMLVPVENRCAASYSRTREYSRECRRRFIEDRKGRLLAERARAQAAPPLPARPPAATPAVPRSIGPTASGVEFLRLGLEVMHQYRSQKAAFLEPWRDRLPELSDRVAAVGRGQTDQLPAPVYQAALHAGRAGNRLKREKDARPVAVPSRYARHEKER